jgi:RNA polymerase sigma-70 factor (family 1)
MMKQTAPYNLIVQFNQREERAFQEVFNDCYPSVVSFAFKFVKDINLAQDICSDSFIKLYRSDAAFTSIGHVKAYLFKITRNGCLDALKSAQREIQNQKQLVQALETDDSNYTKQKEIESELVDLVYKSIETLPPQCRRIFQMNILGMNYEEIAAALNVSISTVRNQKARGLKLLKMAILKERGLQVSAVTVSVVLLELLGGK